MLGVADHVHVEDAVFVEALDDVLGRHADGGDKELGSAIYYYGDEIVQFALGVIVAVEMEC